MYSPQEVSSLEKPQIKKNIQRIWATVSFSDVTRLMAQLASRQTDRKDLNSVDFINKTLEKGDDYPQYSDAKEDLRESPFNAIIKYEKKSLLRMFFIHISDVTLSLCSAFLAIQLLRSFEIKSGTFSLIHLFYQDPTSFQRFLFTAFLAFFIFILNIIAASLHAQKIEREMLLAWRIPIKLMQYMYVHLLGISKKDRTQFQTGDITNMAQNDARYMGDFFSHAFVDFPVLVFSCFLVMCVMLAVIGESAWLGFLVVCMQIPLSLFFSWLGNILHHEMMRRSDKRIQLITEWIQGMRLVRYFGWGQYFQNEINKSAKSEFLQELKVTIKYCIAFALTMNWWMIVSSSIFAGILYFQGNKEASVIFAAIWLSSILGQQIVPLPWFVNVWSQALVGAKRLRSFYETRTQEEEFLKEDVHFYSPEDQKIFEEIISKNNNFSFHLSFSLKNVSLRFSENEPYVLKDINLEIDPQKTLALVGPVASGKSLLIQILMGDILPTEGKVYLNIDIQHPKKRTLSINVHSKLGVEILRSCQSYVPQEAFIVTATVKENIPLDYLSSSMNYDDNHIMNALYSASMGQDIEMFSHKLDTEIGERGVNLSGGQKQRINLARSAFSRSSLIFLDDPLSAVDTNTEKELVKNIFLNEWGQNKTIVWATHRLEFLSHAHKIVFLDSGRIVEQGSYKELTDNRNSRLNQLILNSSAQS